MAGCRHVSRGRRTQRTLNSTGGSVEYTDCPERYNPNG
jgi:hypothetical protein